MASSAPSKLTAFQREVLDAFFQRERGFFLTGGAALAGFHLGHRTTDDLDLFTLQQAAFERSRFILGDVAAAVGAVLDVRQDAPGFKRVVLSRGDEGLVVDLVKDVSSQLHPEKLERDHIVIGPSRRDPREQADRDRRPGGEARSDRRDAPRARWLPDRGGVAGRAGQGRRLHTGDAAWLLSEVTIPDGIELPAGVPPPELRAY